MSFRFHFLIFCDRTLISFLNRNGTKKTLKIQNSGRLCIKIKNWREFKFTLNSVESGALVIR
ncbi:hypothetical protein WN943_023490 [Citrus x changshan-huyou]